MKVVYDIGVMDCLYDMFTEYLRKKRAQLYINEEKYSDEVPSFKVLQRLVENFKDVSFKFVENNNVHKLKILHLVTDVVTGRICGTPNRVGRAVIVKKVEFLYTIEEI